MFTSLPALLCFILGEDCALIVAFDFSVNREIWFETPGLSICIIAFFYCTPFILDAFVPGSNLVINLCMLSFPFTLGFLSGEFYRRFVADVPPVPYEYLSYCFNNGYCFFVDNHF